MKNILLLRPERLMTHPRNMRRFYPSEQVREMANSIAASSGVLQPLIVTKADGVKWIVVDGNMRLAGARLLGSKCPALECKVVGQSEAEQLVSMAVANQIRYDVDPVSEGLHYKALQKEGLSVRDISKRTGIYEARITNRKVLAELDRIYQGDALAVLKTWPDGFVHCAVTSPPYWGLRCYDTEPVVFGGDPRCAHGWGAEAFIHNGGANGGGAATRGRDQSAREAVRDRSAGAFCRCGAWRGQLGLEPTIDLYVTHMVEIFREVRRVLRPDGTLWLNIGDSYNQPGSGGHGATGGLDKSTLSSAAPKGMVPTKKAMCPSLKKKDLIGIPWRVAFALQADGWWLRQDIIWSKPNPMPESVTDRCTKAHEYLFLLTKSPHYYFDAAAIHEPASLLTNNRGHGINPKCIGRMDDSTTYQTVAHNQPKSKKDNGRVDQGLRDSSKFGRGAGWRVKQNESFARACSGPVDNRNKRSVWTINSHPFPEAHFATFPPKLIEPCVLAGAPRAGVVLDPFMGAGTTALVAASYDRRFLGIELNPEYLRMAESRITHEIAQGKLL